MYYFAYGSNMSRKRLMSRLGKVEDVGIATLEGYKISFNKVSNDGTGKTNIIPYNGIVFRVAFILTEVQFAKLDNKEIGYHRETISVT